MELETIKYSVEGPVAKITLDQPGTDNRVSLKMAQEMHLACSMIMEDEGVLVAILTGNGMTFCAGTEEYLEYEQRSSMDIQQYLHNRRVASSISDIQKPMIAAINGDAHGQGLEIALACDIRITAEHSHLSMPQVKYGAIPWDGGTQRLPRIIGQSWASDMLITGRTVTADEAVRIGLVHQVVSQYRLPTACSELADTISNLGPIATRYAKESVQKGMDMTMDQGMRLEMDLNLIIQTTQDRAEGLSSFLEKRKPNFRGN